LFVLFQGLGETRYLRVGSLTIGPNRQLYPETK
jgi:hypothetical protein